MLIARLSMPLKGVKKLDQPRCDNFDNVTEVFFSFLRPVTPVTHPFAQPLLMCYTITHVTPIPPPFQA